MVPQWFQRCSREFQGIYRSVSAWLGELLQEVYGGFRGFPATFKGGDLRDFRSVPCDFRGISRFFQGVSECFMGAPRIC